jgi:hypothetical protein
MQLCGVVPCRVFVRDESTAPSAGSFRDPRRVSAHETPLSARSRRIRANPREHTQKRRSACAFANNEN